MARDVRGRGARGEGFESVERAPEEGESGEEARETETVGTRRERKGSESRWCPPHTRGQEVRGGENAELVSQCGGVRV